MTDAGQPIEQQIRFVTDESSARRVIDAANDIEDAAERVNTALRAAEGAWLPDIVGDANRAERAVRDVEDALEDIDGKRVRVDIDVNEDRIRSRLDTVDRIGSVGSQIAGGLGGGELGNSAGLVGDLAGAFATMNPFVIAATGAIAGLTVGIQVLNSTTEEAENDLKAASSAADIYYDAVRNLSSDDVLNELIPSLQRDTDVLEMQLAEGRAALEANITPAGELLANVAAGLGVSAATTLNEFRAQLDELEQTINTNEHAVARLKTGLENGAFAYNDAIANNELYLEIFGELTQAQLDTAEAAVQLAEAERLAAERRAQTEKEINQRLIAYQQAQQAAQSEAASAYNDQLLDAINNVTEAGADAAKAQNDLANAEQKSAARIADIIAQGQEKQDDLFTDYKERRLDSEEDLNDRLEEIEQRRLKSTHDAIADRDVLAFDMAQDAAQEESEREQKQADKDAARDERNYQRQVQQSERANRRLLDNEYSRQNEELTLKRAAAAAARADLQNAQFAERAIRAQGYMQNINDAAIAGYQIGKTLINAVQSAINAGNFTVVGNDMRFGMGSNQGMTPTQVDRQIENAFRQVFAR